MLKFVYVMLLSLQVQFNSIYKVQFLMNFLRKTILFYLFTANPWQHSWQCTLNLVAYQEESWSGKIGDFRHRWARALCLHIRAVQQDPSHFMLSRYFQIPYTLSRFCRFFFFRQTDPGSFLNCINYVRVQWCV